MLTPTLLAALLAIALARIAKACLCPSQTSRSARRAASVVTVGTVESARDVSPCDGSYQITIERSWKRRLGTAATVSSTRYSCPAEQGQALPG